MSLEKINDSVGDFLPELDTFIHEPVRLGVLLLLKIHKSLPFSELQKALKLTSGNLNSHLNKLNNTGLIEISKKFIDLRPRTLITITIDGRDRLNSYSISFSQFLQSIHENN